MPCVALVRFCNLSSPTPHAFTADKRNVCTVATEIPGSFTVEHEPQNTAHASTAQPPQTGPPCTVPAREALRIPPTKGPRWSQTWPRQRLASRLRAARQPESRRRTARRMPGKLQAPQASAKRAGAPVSSPDDGTVGCAVPSTEAKRTSLSL